jgi:hypothetical protein
LVHWHSWVFSACAVAKAGEAGILNADNPGDVLWSFCDDADRSDRLDRRQNRLISTIARQHGPK